MEYTRPTIRKIKEQQAEGQCVHGSVARVPRCVAGPGGSNIPNNCTNGGRASSSGAPNCSAGYVPV